MPAKHAHRNSDAELAQYRSLLGSSTPENNGITGLTEDLLNAPLFSWSVKRALSSTPAAFTQYALLGHERRPHRGRIDCDGISDAQQNNEPEPLFLNTNAPFSAFLCGAQGSGKSHSLSCILEGCLLPHVATIGRLSQPLAAIVFHYDAWSSSGDGSNGGGICEAAHLASQGVKVRVLASPSNYWALERAYREGVKGGKVEVGVLRLSEGDLSAKRMLTLMALDSKDGRVPLYMEVIHRILRDMGAAAQGRTGFDYRRFKQLLDAERFSADQRGPLNLRMQLLESLMNLPSSSRLPNTQKSNTTTASLFAPEPGTLTIVDLSDPFIDPSSACTLFGVALSLFLEHGASKPLTGRVIALDEAHKYLSTSSETASSAAAARFTSSLLSAIRLQRHAGVRIVIATQEPTVDPRLLDLCSLTIVHRFGSPAWMGVLGRHLAAGGGASKGLAHHVDDADGVMKNSDELFDEIVQMGVGECLVFCPSGVVRTDQEVDGGRGDERSVRRLGREVLRCKTRARITSDGGRSILSMREMGESLKEIEEQQVVQKTGQEATNEEEKKGGRHEKRARKAVKQQPARE
ncbi:uncharacterized protein J3D65DRAFT_684423 [Phyllosticta citribraziliensis]|uniref:P-loop containing nucleoside triphosphate hydrolase protein n=1 Tax=Phyllosticta citribraziliensis TaxID=989973 RepID=A0ABR1LCK3_9PEZI